MAASAAAAAAAADGGGEVGSRDVGGEAAGVLDIFADASALRPPPQRVEPLAAGGTVRGEPQRPDALSGAVLCALVCLSHACS